VTALPTSIRLDGKTAVITGASSGLGRAFALALAEAGAAVALAGRRADRLEEARADIEASGQRAIAIPTDVTDPDACQRLVDETLQQLGRVDVLVNSAGVATVVPALREEPSEFRRVVETNLMGSYWMAQACARHMGYGSSIINVGSVLGQTSVLLPMAAYSASKAALLGLTTDLAQQWGARKGIRVNIVVPGFFHTDMTGDIDADRMQQINETRVPLGRMGSLSECAAAVVFLASDAASFITGTSLVIDGGLLTT
jgi:NAD(P)-dependent dehydrogenase (short-subunit alcohol dehydrogenase family)